MGLTFKLLSVWINLGPSLWHFEGNASGSIDLPLSEVKKLVARMGFKLEVSRVHAAEAPTVKLT